MPDRRDPFLAITIMAAAMGVASVLAVGVMYLQTLDTRQANLLASVRQQAAAVERALASGVASGIEGAFLPQANAALSAVAPESTLRIARRDGEGFAFEPPLRPAEEDIAPLLAKPLERALTGQSGADRIDGASSGPILVAFAPVRGANVAIMAMQPVAPLRARFVDGIAWILGIGIVLMVVGVLSYLGLRRRLGRLLADREERFRSLFESVRSGAVVFKPIDAGEDFLITGFNRGAEWIEGLDRGVVIGKTLLDALPQYKSFGLLHVLRRVWRTGKAEHVPTTFYLAGRTSGWREAYVYRQQTGEVVALYDDVSARKRLEESLRESEAHWRLIVEMQAVGVVLVNSRHEISFANRAAQNMFGKPSHQLIGAPFGLPIAHSNVTEIEIARPGGEIVIVEMRVGSMRWLGEEHTVVFLTDVSAYKRAQGDLRKLFQAIEQSPASVVITDTKGNIEYVNPKFCEVSGYSFAEVIGRNPRILKSGHTSNEEYRGLWQTIASGNVWRGEFQNRHKNGAAYWELASIAPVRDSKGKVTHFVAVKEDVTERRATEERLRAAQRMETIGQLTGGIAHDFNNLLGIILGNLQLLDEIIAEPGEAKELITDALWSAARGGDLTHRLLAFARRQRLNPKVTDVNAVVSEMTELLRRTLGERIEIEENLANDLWPSMIDRGQLESALLNLVVNARDAMDAGGQVTIETRNVEMQSPEESTAVDAQLGSFVMLSVTDTGTGMPPNVVEKIFEPFFTTKKFGQGSGLGLSMVYGFVRQSGGFIEVHSTVDIGTTLRMFLPKAISAPVAKTEQGGAVPGRRQDVVLLVDDDTQMRCWAAAILRRDGYDVHEACDVREAARLVETLPQLDLMISNLVLPEGADGRDLATKVTLQRPGTRVVLMSRDADSSRMDVALRSGAEMLLKPFLDKDLIQKVNAALKRA